MKLEAARKGDGCAHKGEIITGSGDTFIVDAKAARLGDLHTCRSPTPCRQRVPAQGRSSRRAARSTSTTFPRHERQICCSVCPLDRLPRCGHPITVEYNARPEDEHHHMMKFEHEIKERDKVEDEEEPGDGETGEADDPLGVDDIRPPPLQEKAPPSPASQRFDGTGRNVPNTADKQPYADQASPPHNPHQLTTSDENPDLKAQQPMSPPGGQTTSAQAAESPAYVEDVLGVMRRLEESACSVRVLQFGELDLISPAGRLVLTTLAAVAQMERDLLIERTHAGLARARREGKRLGRPRSLTEGQKSDVLDRVNSGDTISSIARDFGVSRATILRVRDAA